MCPCCFPWVGNDVQVCLRSGQFRESWWYSSSCVPEFRCLNSTFFIVSYQKDKVKSHYQTNIQTAIVKVLNMYSKKCYFKQAAPSGGMSESGLVAQRGTYCTALYITVLRCKRYKLFFKPLYTTKTACPCTVRYIFVRTAFFRFRFR